MTTARLILQSLCFHWRTHLGVLLGAALSAMILTGSLTVGDSVRFSLKEIALSRLGNTTTALISPEHFFRAQLAAEIEAQIGVTVAPVLTVRGTVSLPDGSARANEVQIVGVDERFWKLGGTANQFGVAESEVFAANEPLATQLGLKPGDTVVIRVEKPSLLSRDAPLSGAADESIAIRTRLATIAGAAQFGRFSLRANQVALLTVFMPLRELQKSLEKPGRSNVLLAGAAETNRLDETTANAALQKVWTLDDANLEVRTVPPATSGSGKLNSMAEVRTERVFLDPALVPEALKAAPNATGVLTYLVNEIRRGTKATPYSMVTAADCAEGVPKLADREIAINSWLAEDLGAKPGDSLTLRYFVIATNGQLVERTSQFRIRAILPLESPDPSWMPMYPGLADVENCRDWKPGIPIDSTRIRPKDEDYWQRFHGTPKAFVSLRAGQAMWSNRFGNLTAIRYPLTEATSMESIKRALHDKIDPKQAGFLFQPVRQQALDASRGSQDFGQLFIGFSFFLVVAALSLMGMLFVFNLQQRTADAGVLLALGFTRVRVRRVLLWEGYAVATIGVLAGVAIGADYTKLALHGLSTVWHNAVNLSEFHYHGEWSTLIIGGASSLGAGLLATWIAGRGQARRSAAELLANGADLEFGGPPRGTLWSIATAGLCAAGATALLVVGGRSAEAFFEAGGLLLIGGIAASRALLLRLSHAKSVAGNLASIGFRGASRRPGRSLTTVAVLASGIFMVVAVSAFREDPLQHAHERASGTGGFALIGRSTLPIYEDFNGNAGRQAFGLTPEAMQGVKVVAMRVKDGDEASCLNLNSTQQPRFLGVRAGAFASRKAFTFIDAVPEAPHDAGWKLLGQTDPNGAVPAIGDEATVRWALGKSVGDTIACTDDHGGTFQVRIVAMIADSILQGSLVISDEAFVERFPSASGSRQFLIDAPWETSGELAATLSRALRERGLELVPTWRRLADFQAVENSYLSIFQALGGLGLLLGSAGLGIVVMRNVLERRSELALLQAVGFSGRALRMLVVSEHLLLIALGVGVGGVTAAVAVLPSLLAPGAQASLTAPLLTLGLLAAGSAAWSWLAAWAALRGPLMAALRSE